MSKKVSTFIIGMESVSVSFVETQTVKEGVECDIYTFVGDNTKDLAIVRVQQGYKTPLQRVLLGDKTVEGYVGGSGTLTVQSDNGEVKTYTYTAGESDKPVLVRVGQVMQWFADGESELTFYEICEPPYKDGRFENLAE